ncbi:MAG: hypothetical protein ABIU96_04005 [Rhodanobacter sp.]
MAGDDRFVTRAEFARLRGCTGPYVTKLGHQGRLVLDASGKRVNVSATLALLAQSDDPARGGDRTGRVAPADGFALARPATGAPLAAAREEILAELPTLGDSAAYKGAATRERMAKARLAELELAEKSGNLVRRDEVEAAVFGLARQAQDALVSIADRLSTQLAAEADPSRVHALLSEEVTRVMQQIAAARPLPALTAEQLAVAAQVVVAEAVTA